MVNITTKLLTITIATTLTFTGFTVVITTPKEVTALSEKANRLTSIPGKPTNLTTYITQDNHINASWDAPNELGRITVNNNLYKVKLQNSLGDEYETITSKQDMVFDIKQLNLKPDTRYTVSVTTLDNMNESEPVQEVVRTPAEPPSEPLKPLGVTTPNTDGTETYRLAWVAPDNSESTGKLTYTAEILDLRTNKVITTQEVDTVVAVFDNLPTRQHLQARITAKNKTGSSSTLSDPFILKPNALNKPTFNEDVTQLTNVTLNENATLATARDIEDSRWVYAYLNDSSNSLGWATVDNGDASWLLPLPIEPGSYSIHLYDEREAFIGVHTFTVPEDSYSR